LLQPFDHLSDASLHITHKKEKIFRVGVRSTRAFDCLLRAAPAEELVEPISLDLSSRSLRSRRGLTSAG